MKKLERKTREKKKLTAEHAEWLVESRCETQRSEIRLFRLLTGYPGWLENEALAEEAHTLIAISFSLWRSAFLADKTMPWKDTNVAAITFLGEVIQNNAIAYLQDRTSKDWTFNYYASNAR